MSSSTSKPMTKLEGAVKNTKHTVQAAMERGRGNHEEALEHDKLAGEGAQQYTTGTKNPQVTSRAAPSSSGSGTQGFPMGGHMGVPPANVAGSASGMPGTQMGSSMGFDYPQDSMGHQMGGHFGAPMAMPPPGVMPPRPAHPGGKRKLSKMGHEGDEQMEGDMGGMEGGGE